MAHKETKPASVIILVLGSRTLVNPGPSLYSPPELNIYIQQVACGGEYVGNTRMCVMCIGQSHTGRKRNCMRIEQYLNISDSTCTELL